MRVKIKPVKVFEVIGRTGKLEHLQQVGREWNNMIELQDGSGAKLILMRDSGIMSHALAEAIGDGTTDLTVISGSQSLLEKLGLSPRGEQD